MNSRGNRSSGGTSQQETQEQSVFLKILHSHLFRQMFLYGIIGGSCSLIDAGAYFMFTRFCHLHEFLANFISVNIGICLSFCLNSHFTFHKTDHMVQRGLRFFSIGYVGLAISMGLLYVGTNLLGLSDILVKLGSIVIVAAIQFVLNKLVTFSDRQTKTDRAGKLS